MKISTIFIVAVSAITLTGCMIPGGYSGMMDAVTGSGMSGTSYIGGSSIKNGGISGGGFFDGNGNRIRPGSGGMSGANAADFAQNVIKLKIGESTSEDANVLLGAPGMKSKFSGSEIWQYPLYTGGMPGLGVLTFNNSGVLKGIKVMKTSVSGGSVGTEEVYSRGNMNSTSY